MPGIITVLCSAIFAAVLLLNYLLCFKGQNVCLGMWSFPTLIILFLSTLEHDKSIINGGCFP